MISDFGMKKQQPTMRRDTHIIVLSWWDGCKSNKAFAGKILPWQGIMKKIKNICWKWNRMCSIINIMISESTDLGRTPAHAPSPMNLKRLISFNPSCCLLPDTACKIPIRFVQLYKTQSS
jgi:hypothetical protein